MHGIQSRAGLPELGYKHPDGHPNIAKLAMVVGATVLSGQAAGAADTSQVEGKRDASAIASATIVRPFEITVPKQYGESSDTKSIGSISILDTAKTECIRDCAVLLGSDVDAVRTRFCKLYLIDLQ